MIQHVDETNGNPATLIESLRQDMQELNALESSMGLWPHYITTNDSDAPGNDPNWHIIGGVRDSDIEFSNESQLSQARKICRWLASQNEYAINGHENRISYIVGTGHKYTAVAKHADVEEKLVADVQQVIDTFVRQNKWHRRQQEIVRRMDRDGECFLRFFVEDDALLVRFVEPWQVSTPPKMQSNEHAAFGILNDEQDAETVVAYFVDGDEVDATEIQHRKANVDSTSKRGVPTFWPVEDKLRRIEKICRTIAIVASIQSKIAIIRKHRGTNATKVQDLVNSKKDGISIDVITGKRTTYEQYPEGAVLDASDKTEYEFPTSGVDATRYIALMQAMLRGVASRLVMPEFMLTSDASNANFASTMVAEGPAVKHFERLQAGQREDDVAVLRTAIEVAEDANQLPENSLDQVEIQVGMPTLITRDRMEEAQAAEAYLRMNVLSPQTIAGRIDVDYQQEQENLRAHRDADFGAIPGVDSEGNEIPPDDTTAEPRTDDVQKTALNGAQVQAAIEIVQLVVSGQMPRDAAIGQLMQFFQLDQQQAESVLGSAGQGFTPEPGQKAGSEAASVDGDEQVAGDK